MYILKTPDLLGLSFLDGTGTIRSAKAGRRAAKTRENSERT